MSTWVLLAGRRAHWGLNWELYRPRRSSVSSAGWSSGGAVPRTRARRASARARSLASRRRRSARSWSRDGRLGGTRVGVKEPLNPGGPPHRGGAAAWTSRLQLPPPPSVAAGGAPPGPQFPLLQKTRRPYASSTLSGLSSKGRKPALSDPTVLKLVSMTPESLLCPWVLSVTI